MKSDKKCPFCNGNVVFNGVGADSITCSAPVSVACPVCEWVKLAANYAEAREWFETRGRPWERERIEAKELVDYGSCTLKLG